MNIQRLRTKRIDVVIIIFALLFSFSSAAQTPESESAAMSTPDQNDEIIPHPPSQRQMEKIRKHLIWLREKAKGQQAVSMEKVKGQQADFTEENLSGVNLSGKDLDRAIFWQANLTEADLSRAKFSRANLSRAILKRANLRDANLGHADLAWAILSDADLTWANLKGADLSHVNLSRAKLNGADLSASDLGGVNFDGATLTNVILSRANLKSADLSAGVGLSATVWGEGVVYDANTRWPQAFPLPRNLGTLQGKIGLFIEKYWLAIVLFSLVGLVAFVSFVVYRWKRKIKEQTDKIFKQEEVLKEKTTANIVEFVEAELKVASEREKLAMLIAQVRSGRLFVIGSFLMVLSVFAPFGSAAIYWQTDPLNDEVVMRLEQLKKKADITPASESISLKKDWRILFSGLSFGFLFLAAARGILKQEARQSSTYFVTSERVTHYENLGRALRINDRLKSEAQPSENDKVVRRIIEKLFESPEQKKDESQTKDSELAEGLPFKEPIEAILNALKRSPD
jgi:hypothetical protein